ncbi:unnamed protein product [Phaeothamnion confervicola]
MDLLAMLDSPVGQRVLGAFARRTGTQESLFFWSDVCEFQAIPTSSYRFSKAKQIYGKYIKTNAVQALSFVTEEHRATVAAALAAAAEDRSLVGQGFFKELQSACLQELLDHTYLRFKADEERYTAYTEEVRSMYNRVTIEDFDYMEKLGEGAFGRVVHVRKISTGRHYAMKIQIKQSLIRNYSDDPSKLDNEKVVFAACNHPFIMQMDYAFQTPCHAILVLQLVTSGNLQDAIDASPHQRLEPGRARFYTAEMVLALLHLHDMGLMYRDLKPRNVMLGEDGHVLLTDMGGVGDFHGDMSARRTRKMNSNVAAGSRASFRRRSIMGTKGYMAPEMVKLMGQSHTSRKGYTRAVDWWSLGVTLYKLITGKRPFDPPPRGRVGNAIGGIALWGQQSEYERLLVPPRFPEHVSADAVSFIRGLLDTAEQTRLGSGPNKGRDGLMNHPYFAGLDWDRLQDKLVEPPFLPQVTPPGETPSYLGYDDMMDTLDLLERAKRGSKQRDWRAEPSEENQRLFRNWHYVSPQTLRVEMGISNEMDAIESNYKAHQLLVGEGSASPSPSSGFPGLGIIRALSHSLSQSFIEVRSAHRDGGGGGNGSVNARSPAGGASVLRPLLGEQRPTGTTSTLLSRGFLRTGLSAGGTEGRKRGAASQDASGGGGGGTGDRASPRTIEAVGTLPSPQSPTRPAATAGMSSSSAMSAATVVVAARTEYRRSTAVTAAAAASGTTAAAVAAEPLSKPPPAVRPLLPAAADEKKGSVTVAERTRLE